MSEGKIQAAAGNRRLERLLHRLLRMEADRRIRDLFVLIKGFRGDKVLTRKGQQISG